MVWQLGDLPREAQLAVGGKARVLARLTHAGFPVPTGMVIAPQVFADGDLRPPAWERVQAAVTAMRRDNRVTAFAVRPSAVSEDSAAASFAGEFETLLNVSTDEQIRQAIRAVYHSEV